ncbi:MAG TPA: hypothetical protein VLM05_04175 [Mycobacteriales bacterium]|nr:hypothetical protein [Mycobacteriales bacterium]
MDELTRRLWHRFEVIHDVVYFDPRVAAAAKALGLRGYWMGYFAFRAAPLGPVGPAVVTAVFYGFHRSRVERALPDAWTYTTPEAAIAAREAAIDEAFADFTGLDEAADLAWRAAQAADTAGRPLAAANQALPRPASPRVALWQATAVLREHRGDGHNAVLVARGIGPAEAHLLKGGAGESDVDVLRTGRGWPDDEWARARERLGDLLDADGRLTAAGRAEHDAIEAATDRAARRPWEALGEADATRLLDLLHPVAAATVGTGLVPQPNPVGLTWTGA